MGFVRNQEEKLAMRLLAWKYQKAGMPLPELSVLREQATGVVDEAHQIAKKHGRNVMSIIKDLTSNLTKKHPDA